MHLICGEVGLGWVIGVAILGLFSGCATAPLSDTVLGPGYQPGNFFRADAVFPDNLRRVAVLPLTARAKDINAEAGIESLQPVLWGELAKTRLFELVLITPDQLRNWTGRPQITAEEKLPERFFEQVRASAGCDAVLFTQLSQYRPYHPLAVGWNMKLVSCVGLKTWWSLDEVFDAGETLVVNGARRYYQHHLLHSKSLADSQSILTSPRWFAQYTLSASLATLPGR
jgi:hypothetical protein